MTEKAPRYLVLEKVPAKINPSQVQTTVRNPAEWTEDPTAAVAAVSFRRGPQLDAGDIWWIWILLLLIRLAATDGTSGIIANFDEDLENVK